MFKGAVRLLASVVGGHSDSPSRTRTIEVGVNPPPEIFPIHPQYNYCELFQPRMVDEVHLTLQVHRKPWKIAFYILKTDDLSLVEQWVRAEGFSASRVYFGTQYKRFSDPDGNYFFFSRKDS